MKNDGGPAFPELHFMQGDDNKFTWQRQYGMTLRDYFAAAALQGMLSSVTRDHTATVPSASNGFPIDRSKYAVTAFQYADAMLAERNK